MSRDGVTAARRTATPAAAAAAKVPMAGLTREDDGGGGGGVKDALPAVGWATPFGAPPGIPIVRCCCMAADAEVACEPPAVEIGLPLWCEWFWPTAGWWWGIAAAAPLPVRPPKSAPKEGPE